MAVFTRAGNTSRGCGLEHGHGPPGRSWRTLLLFLLGTCLLLALGPAARAAVPAFRDDHSIASLRQAVERSLDYLRNRPPGRRHRLGDRWFTTREMRDSLECFLAFLERNPDKEALAAFVRDNYVALPARDRGGRTRAKAVVTGYFEPVIDGSLVQTPEFRYPLLKAPPDLALLRGPGGKARIGRMERGRLVPYLTRAEIELRAWPDELILCWVRDPVVAFFLQVQGSGRIRLPDGETRGIHYHITNGHPYRSIGRYMVESGRITLEEATLESVKNYLYAHPGERGVILHHNPSYVFFRWEERDGAIGNIEVPLTPGRSIAVDQSIFPPGALAYLQTRQPVLEHGQVVGWRPLERFVLAQDSGSAIKGPGRVDLFWGRGEEAGRLAGSMKERGRLHFLILRRHADGNRVAARNRP